MKKYLIIILIITLPALWPFFHRGFFESQDGEWMIIRFTAFHQTLRSGQFPVRFVDRLYNNYGYPVINFLYPLPFYTSEIWKLSGLGFVNSIKLTFILSTIASTLAMFWALSQDFDPLASFAGSLVYIYVPYRFVDLYVRGSIGENMAFVFLPLIFGCIAKIKRGKEIYWPILAFAIAGLITSHNVIAFIFAPIFFIYSVFIVKLKFKNLVIFFLLGFFASAFFWLPAIFDLRYVKFTSITVADTISHLVSIRRLIIPVWGNGPNPNGPNPLPIQVGIVTIGIFFSTLIKRWIEKKRVAKIDYFIIVFVISIFLMITWSKIFWQNLLISKLIQFPWRLLSVIVFSSSIFAAYIIDQQKNAKILLLIISAAAIISTIYYTSPKIFVDRPDTYYSTNEGSTTVQDEYLPIWVSRVPDKRENEKVIISKGGGVITSQSIKPANYKLNFQANSPVEVTVNTFFFPGWTVKADNKNIPDSSNSNGLIQFNLPQGNHILNIFYGETPFHLFSEWLSIVATLYLFVTYFHFIKKSDDQKKAIVK